MPSVASIHRPLDVRLRPDLLSAPVQVAGAVTWVVKDPLTLEHFHFTAEEYALVDMLRESRSLDDLRRSFESQFAPQRITHHAVWSFLGRLHGLGLLVSSAPEQGEELRKRQKQDRLRQWSLAWAQVLAIRFRGVDPDAFLTRLYARLGWLFTPATFVVLAALVLWAGSLLLMNFAQFRSRLPELSALADWRNLPYLMLAIAVAKVLHELGHALATKHFGGEVRELGLLLLAFTPCLYCDVSDVWRLPRRRQRILVSAAGMLVELGLASLAVIIWWHTQPGVVQLVALNLAVVCSVSTLVVNGNPLLRYDGYYILSDLTDTPNLWQRSREVLRGMASRVFLGLKPPADAFTPRWQRPWLALYALASKLYLTLVIVGIVWMVVQVLRPLHLENLAYGVGLLALGGVLVGPTMNTARLVRNPVHRRQVRRGRASLWVAVMLAGVVGLFSLPWTYRVEAPLVIVPSQPARIYATVEGSLVNALPPGAEVNAGETVARLANPEVALQLEQVAGDLRLAELRVSHLEALRGRDRSASDQLPAARAALAATAAQLEAHQRDARRLTLTAPTSGHILPTPPVESAERDSGRLAAWTGSLLDERNQGALVQAGTLICLVGDPHACEALLLVDDAELERVRPGQSVRLLLDQWSQRITTGEVVEVARHEAHTSANTAASDAALDRLLEGIIPPGRGGTQYYARVRFDTPDAARLIAGGRGRAKIDTDPMPLARHLLRLLVQTFRTPV